MRTGSRAFCRGAFLGWLALAASACGSSGTLAAEPDSRVAPSSPAPGSSSAADAATLPGKPSSHDGGPAQPPAAHDGMPPLPALPDGMPPLPAIPDGMPPRPLFDGRPPLPPLPDGMPKPPALPDGMPPLPHP